MQLLGLPLPAVAAAFTRIDKQQIHSNDSSNNQEDLRKWHLIFVGQQNDGTSFSLDGQDLSIDKTPEALYDSNKQRSLGPSSPNVSRWLGDIRTFFPNSVVQVMQQDALKRLNLTQMLFEKVTLENISPDVQLVATLMTLSRVIPAKTKDTARQVVRKVVVELMKKIREPTQQAAGSSGLSWPPSRPYGLKWSSSTRP